MSRDDENRRKRTQRKESAKWLDHLDLIVEPNLPNGRGRTPVSWDSFLEAFPYYPANIRK